MADQPALLSPLGLVVVHTVPEISYQLLAKQDRTASFIRK
jgi:hypothetical protein